MSSVASARPIPGENGMTLRDIPKAEDVEMDPNGSAFIREYFDNTVRDKHDISNAVMGMKVGVGVAAMGFGGLGLAIKISPKFNVVAGAILLAAGITGASVAALSATEYFVTRSSLKRDNNYLNHFTHQFSRDGVNERIDFLRSSNLKTPKNDSSQLLAAYDTNFDKAIDVEHEIKPEFTWFGHGFRTDVERYAKHTDTNADGYLSRKEIELRSANQFLSGRAQDFEFSLAVDIHNR